MPFIMLPTVEYVDDSKKSPSAATGHSPQERRSPDSIFTSFSAKSDLGRGEDFSPSRARQQQQRPTENEDGGVCDLNRYSSPNVGQISQISTTTTPASFVLSSSSPMTAGVEKMNGGSLTTSAAGSVFAARSQIAFVTLIRQLSYVTSHADAVFRRLSTDIELIGEQSSRLKSRVDILQLHADSLLGKKAAKTNSCDGLVRYTNIKKHYRSVAEKDKDEDKERRSLFTPRTRPSTIVAFYEAAEVDPAKKRIPSSTPSPPVEHCSTQTEDIRTSRTRRSAIRRGVTLAVVESESGNEESSKRVFRPSSTSNLVRQQQASEVDDNGLRSRPRQCSTAGGGGDYRNEIDDTTIRIWKGGSGQKSASTSNEASNSATRSTKLAVERNSVKATTTTIVIDTSSRRAASKLRTNNFSHYAEIVKRSNSNEKITSPNEIIIIEDDDYSSSRKRSSTSSRRTRSARRNTVAGCELPNGDYRNEENMAEIRNDRRDDSRQKKSVDFTAGTTGDSIVNDVVYEFAPFYRRKSKPSAATTQNFFSSLRRLKKDKRVVSPPIAVSTPIKSSVKTDDVVDYSSPYYSTKNEMSSSMHSDSAALSPELGPTSDDLPPSQKNGTGSAIKGLKQLFQRSTSLRRSKKEKRQSNLDDQTRPPPPLPPPRSAPPSRQEQPKSVDEEDSENRSTTSSSLGFQRNYVWRPKSNLPISTTSQVIHVAAQLRDYRPSPTLADGKIAIENEQRLSKLSSSSSRDSAYSSCGKKLRPPSVVSLASLDFTENKVNGWYRQGYQLEYPDEIVREEPAAEAKTIHSSIPAKLPIIEICKMQSRAPQRVASRDTSNSSPYSDASSFVDSNFSCDREGYFTTMHRDCGLVKNDGNGVEKSIANRNRSIFADKDRDTEVSSNSSLNTVTEPMVEPMPTKRIQGQTIHPTLVGELNRRRPPDLSLTPAAIQTTTRPPVLPTPPMSAASEAEIKFDLWLMSKFHAEQRMQHFRQQQQKNTGNGVDFRTPPMEKGGGSKFFGRNFGRFSLPRCKKENNQNSKNGYVAEYLRNLGNDENELSPKLLNDSAYARSPVAEDLLCTMPRKTVCSKKLHVHRPPPYPWHKKRLLP